MTSDGTEWPKTRERLTKLAAAYRRKAAAVLTQPRFIEAFRQEKAYLYRRFSRVLLSLAGEDEGKKADNPEDSRGRDYNPDQPPGKEAEAVSP